VAAIEAIRDTGGLLDTGARCKARCGCAFQLLAPTKDFKDSSKVIGEANQGGLTLPDRDYYTRDDDESKKLRQQFVEHIGKLLVLAGDAQEKSTAEATTIMGIETSLAKASMTNVERRDPEKIYHKMSVGDAQALTHIFR